MATHSSILPGEFHGQRNLVGYSPWGHKESDMSEAKSSHSVASECVCDTSSHLLSSLLSRRRALSRCQYLA